MNYIDIASLKEYPVNKETRIITPKNYQRLKESLQTEGQREPLKVTVDNVVIGGNHRVQAMRDLGWTKASYDLIEFQEEPEGWMIVKNGEPNRMVFYKTKSKAMLEFSIDDNDNTFATYVPEQIMVYLDLENIPHENVYLTVDEPISFNETVNARVNVDKVADAEEAPGEKEIKEIDVTCPFCQKQFKKEV